MADLEPDRVTGPVHVTDHVDKGLGRLVARLRNKTLVRALLTAFLVQIQELEDALWALYADTLTTAIGAQLDVLGRVIGEPRGSFGDDAYRSLLRAAVRANRSSGTGDELLAIARLLLGVGPAFTLTEYPRATVMIEPAGPWPSAEAAVRVLRKAKSGGVQLQVIAPTLPDDSKWFSFASSGLLEEPDTLRGFGDVVDPLKGGRLVEALV